MTITFRSYEQQDFMRVRQLLVDAFPGMNGHGNWLIDRWSFCRYVSQTMHNTFDTWENTVGLWIDESGKVVGVVNSEGEQRAEAFFQLREPLPDSVLEEMFAFAEERLSSCVEGQNLVRLRILEGDSARERIASARGYTRLQWTDELSVLSLEQLPPAVIPSGFSIQDGTQVSPLQKAVAHAKAFGYYREGEDCLFPLAFERITQAPDYRPELDVSLVAEATGEAAAFCTLWLDEQNKHGILEPVGVSRAFQRIGLGRAVVTEAMRRAAEAGAQKAYVGSSMPFYRAVGFQPFITSIVWEKILAEN
jgi:GNAT superfamily N-acetyltransferase